jgi:hypothetical protein
LIIASPFLALAYRVIKQLGMRDKLTGKDKTLEGLKRLRSTARYPVNFIQDNDEDRTIFDSLLKRLTKRCKESKITDLLKNGHRPIYLATAGLPIEIKGTPPE